MSRRTRTKVVGGWLASAAAIAIVVSGCSEQDTDPAQEAVPTATGAIPEPAQDAAMASLDDVLGKSVALEGQVDEVLNQFAFALELEDGSGTALVVHDGQAEVSTGGPVEVVGKVREFESGQFQQELGLPEELQGLEEWTHQSAVMALDVHTQDSPSPTP